MLNADLRYFFNVAPYEAIFNRYRYIQIVAFLTAVKTSISRTHQPTKKYAAETWFVFLNVRQYEPSGILLFVAQT